MTESREERIVGYFTIEEYKAFKHAAIELNTTIGAYVRKLVLAELKRLENSHKQKQK